MDLKELINKRQRMQELMNAEEYEIKGEDAFFMDEYNQLSQETAEMFSNLNDDDFDYVNDKLNY